MKRALIWILAVACVGENQQAEGQKPLPVPVVAPVVAATQVSVPELEWELNRPLRYSRAAVATDSQLSLTREILAKVVQDHGRDPNNPWAVSHSLLAFGPELELTNGRKGIDWLFETYALEAPVGELPGIRFPKKAGAIRIEPHTDLILKALTEIGVAPDYPVKVGEKSLQVGDLYRHSLSTVWVDGETVSVGSWNDTPWTLQALVSWAPKELSWTSAGHLMTLDTYTSSVVTKLGEETAFMRQAIRTGGTVQKRGQGIFGYTCGGAHFLQSAAYAVAQGYGLPKDRERIREEVDVLFWRLDLELGIVDEALKQHPEYALVLIEQRMKFLGHFLETAHKLAALELYEPTAEQSVALSRGRSELVNTVGVLQAMGVFDRLDELRQSNEQTYLDFIGDSAHALRGIDLSTGQGSIR